MLVVTEMPLVSRFNANLTTLVQSTYLGGAGNDYAMALAIHPASGEVYVAGNTNSPTFPTTSGGAQAVYGGTWVRVVAMPLSPGFHPR